MGRPRSGDPVYQQKRDVFNRLRDQGVSLRDCAKNVGITTSTAQTWERDRRVPVEPLDRRAAQREQLQRAVTEGLPEERGRASQVYWRVRLGAPPEGATAWHTEHLAFFVNHLLDLITLEEVFAEAGEEGRALWPIYLAAMGQRAGLMQREDGTWTADPNREPPSRA